MGFMFHGVAMDRPFRSAAELKSSLPMPLVATIQGDGSECAGEKAGERTPWVVMGALVIVVTLAVVLRLGGWL